MTHSSNAFFKVHYRALRRAEPHVALRELHPNYCEYKNIGPNNSAFYPLGTNQR